MMRAVVITIARVVAFPELPQSVDNSLSGRTPITSVQVNDYDVEIGLFVPATPSPGAEENDALRVRLGHQLPAEVDGGRVGIPGGPLEASGPRYGGVSPGAWHHLRPDGTPASVDLRVVGGGGHGGLQRGDEGGDFGS